MMIKSEKQIYNWLLIGCLLIASMVVIGGVTRLTRSGLSIVEWKPIKGTLPPLNQIAWEAEFELYKKSPEFKVYNHDFQLDDFKKIYFWEYLHRLLGRIIGLVFFIPCLVFWLKGYFNSEMKKKVIFIFMGGLFQGFIGWFMVKSGLVKMPHVSHYRLMIHFMTALGLMMYIFYVALCVKHKISSKTIKFSINWYLKLFLFIVLLQLIYGAFVAGLKAGFMYNTFPKMNDRWIAKEVFYEFNLKGIGSLIESHPTVQLIHRILGIICVLFGCFLWYFETRKQNKNRNLYRVLSILFFTQVLLGILTLIFVVPVALGVIHQTFAIFLVLTLVYVLFKERYYIED